jgi:hypothetical protein
MSVEEFVAEALRLDPETRTRVAEQLLQSLYEPLDRDIERAWAEEATRRNAEWDNDPSVARLVADVLRDARSRLR